MRPNLFARLVGLSLEVPLAVILVWVALAAAGATYGALTLTFNLKGTGFVSPDPGLAGAERRLEDAFPATGETIALVVESDDPKAARDGAAALAHALASEPRFFKSAYAPGTDEFFARYGVLYLDQAGVEDTVRRVEQSAALYRAIAASPDFAGLAALAVQAARAIAVGRSPRGLNALFAEAAATVEGEIAGRRHELDWPALVASSADLNSKRWSVLAAPVKAREEGYRPALARARALAQAASANAPSRLAITLTGRPLIAAEGTALSAAVFVLPAGMVGLVLILVLAFGLTRPGLIAAFLFALILAFMASAGAAALISPELDRITLSSPLVYLALATPAMIAMSVRAEEQGRSGTAEEMALMVAAHRLGPAFLAWMAAVSLGAACAYGSAFVSLAKLALLTAALSGIVFLAALTLLPALLCFALAGSTAAAPREVDRLLDAPAPPAWRALRSALVAMLLAVAVWFTILLPGIRIDAGAAAAGGGVGELLGELARYEPSLAVTAEVVANPGQDARVLAVRLASLPEVARVRWIESFLPSGEAAKRAILSRLDGVLPKLPDQSAEADDARMRAELSRLEQALLDIANDPRTEGDLKEAASEFRRSLALFDGSRPASPEAVRRLENALFVRLPLLLDRVAQLANLPPLSVASLDPELVRRFVGVDGSWRIEAVPRDNIGLERFAAAVRAVASNAAGPAMIAAQTPRLMLAGLGLAVLGMIVLTFLAGLALTGKLLAAVRIAVPLALVTLMAAGGLVYGAKALAPEDMGLIIAALAMLAGAGFIAERWHFSASGWTRQTGAARPRAILASYLVFAAILVPLMLSPATPLKDLGMLAAIAAALDILASFIVAPELARWTRRRP